MERVTLKNENITNEYLVSISNDTAKVCNCYFCGGCVLCIIFAPAVAGFTAIGLGVGLTKDQKG